MAAPAELGHNSAALEEKRASMYHNNKNRVFVRAIAGEYRRVLARLDALGAGSVDYVERPEIAVKDVDAIHTDTWTSMGQESERQARLEAFKGFTVTSELMALAAPGVGFYHCMPAYRGVEVSAERNPQMSAYGLGALAEFGDLVDYRTVRLVISQPRVTR